MRNVTRFLAGVFATVAVAAAVTGCGSSDGFPRQPVRGTVTLDGKPLEKGMITFTPTGAPEPIVSAVVADGVFELARSDGPVPGAHRVDVWSPRPTGKKVRDTDNRGQLVEEVRESIPARYNLRSELTAQVQSGKSNTFDFPLQGETRGPASKRDRLASRTEYVPTPR